MSEAANRKTAAQNTGAYSYRLGAIFYVLWGVWHLQVVYNLYNSATSLQEPTRARLSQGAFHILAFVLCAIFVGIFLNWKNSRTGYWINLLAIAWTEIGLFFIIFPSLPTLPPSIFVGPVLWIIAVALSTIGYLTQPTSP